MLNDKGVKFEEGMEKLGNFLGYDAGNAESGGAPDPWWVLNEKVCIVSESKIYESDSKIIPLKDVRESAGHPNWIREHIDSLDEDADILNIFITNANKIDNIAKVQADGIYYLNKVKLIDFAKRALAVVKTIKKNYTSEGSMTWREYAKEELVKNKVTQRIIST